MGVHVGGLDVVPLLAAIAGCHCWAAIAGDRGGVGVQVGGLDVVTLLGAIAGLPLLGAIVGDRGGVYTLADWTWCRGWLPLLDPIAGLPLLGIGVGWVYTLADWTWCSCWLPLLGIGGGGCTSWRIGCDGCMPLLVPLLRAIARNHCEKKLTRVLHRSPLPFSLH